MATESYKQDVRMEAYMGPLPPPDALAAYEAVLPGCAERMLAIVEKQWELAEAQANHRQEIEKQVVASEVRMANRGQIFALIIAITGMLIALIISLIGHPVEGVVAIFLNLAGLAGVFVYGARTRRNERIEKTRILVDQLTSQ